MTGRPIRGQPPSAQQGRKGPVMALTLIEASREARRLDWADTTRSVNILVTRNGREREYAFDRGGKVIGRMFDGELVQFDHPWQPR